MSEHGPESRRHVPALDGVRGIAILLVLIHNLSIHEQPHGIAMKAWATLVDVGWIGVQLFFVLSGYLITGILLDDRDEPRALRTFYIRRSLRIWPLYYVFLIGYAIFVLPHVEGPASYIVWYALYLSNWSDITHDPLPGLGPFWSLAVEEQFYLTWPWLVTRVRPITAARACVAIALLAAAARIAFQIGGFSWMWTYSSTIARADGLALGALVALAIRNDQWRAWLDRALTPAFMTSLLGLAGLVAITHGLERRNWKVEVFGFSLLTVLFAALVAAIVLSRASRLGRWHETSVLRAAGRYSYAAYVLHLPIKLVVLRRWGGAWLTDQNAAHPLVTDVLFVLAASGAAFAAAGLSYVVIERPFLRLKDRWAPR